MDSSVAWERPLQMYGWHGHYPIYIPIAATEDDQDSEFILRGVAEATCTNELPPDEAEPPG